MAYVKCLLSAIIISVLNFNTFCQNTHRITYAVTDQNEKLYMDVYSSEGNGSSILFVHGGGFEGGDPEGQKPFAEEMQRRGYQVFVISYRLLMKGRGFGCDIPTEDKLNAIRAGVEDAARATTFLLENKDELNIDPAHFWVAGSSAGAEVVLQLLFNPFKNNNTDLYTFPSDFKYKGAMLFAGAIIDLRLIKKENWVPMLLFHGKEDTVVPLDAAPHRYCRATDPGWLMFFGSQAIYHKAASLGLPVELHLYKGKGHEVANHMFIEFDIIEKFLQRSSQNMDWNPKLIEH